MIYAICGLPASGKTTLSQQLANEKNLKLYCYDTFPKEQKGLSHQKMYKQIAQDLLLGHDVVLDNLHLALKWRQDLLSAIQDIPCKKILIVMTTTLEECIRRNVQRENPLPESVIRHLHERYQPPSLDEGWDEILYY